MNKLNQFVLAYKEKKENFIAEIKKFKIKVKLFKREFYYGTLLHGIVFLIKKYFFWKPRWLVKVCYYELKYYLYIVPYLFIYDVYCDIRGVVVFAISGHYNDLVFFYELK